METSVRIIKHEETESVPFTDYETDPDRPERGGFRCPACGAPRTLKHGAQDTCACGLTCARAGNGLWLWTPSSEATARVAAQHQKSRKIEHGGPIPKHAHHARATVRTATIDSAHVPGLAIRTEHHACPGGAAPVEPPEHRARYRCGCGTLYEQRGTKVYAWRENAPWHARMAQRVANTLGVLRAQLHYAQWKARTVVQSWRQT